MPKGGHVAGGTGGMLPEVADRIAVIKLGDKPRGEPPPLPVAQWH